MAITAPSPYDFTHVPSKSIPVPIVTPFRGHSNSFAWSGCVKLKTDKKRPLHIDIHGGVFIGGIPEYDAPFCMQLAEMTGAVVVSVTYRFAPRYTFPAAHDDVEDAVAWLVKNAEREFNADPELVTVTGFSAGGNLALGATLGTTDGKGEKLVKGAVTFYNPVDLRLPPQEKRKPPGFPSFDPAASNACTSAGSPDAILFIIPTIDFLLYEQLDMVERLQKEVSQEEKKTTSSLNSKRIEKLIFEGQLHGWLEYSAPDIPRSSPLPNPPSSETESLDENALKKVVETASSDEEPAERTSSSIAVSEEDCVAPSVMSVGQETRISIKEPADVSTEDPPQQMRNSSAEPSFYVRICSSGSQRAPEVTASLPLRPSVEGGATQVDTSAHVPESSVNTAVMNRDSPQPQTPITEAPDTRANQDTIYRPKHHVNSPTMNLDSAAPVQDEDKQQEQNTSTEPSNTEITLSASKGHERNGDDQTPVAKGVTQSENGSNQIAPLSAPAPAPALGPALAPAAALLTPITQVAAIEATDNASGGPRQQDDSLMARSRLFNDSMTDPMDWIESSMMEDNPADVDMVENNMVIDDGNVETTRPQHECSRARVNPFQPMGQQAIRHQLLRQQQATHQPQTVRPQQTLLQPEIQLQQAIQQQGIQQQAIQQQAIQQQGIQRRQTIQQQATRERRLMQEQEEFQRQQVIQQQQRVQRQQAPSRLRPLVDGTRPSVLFYEPYDWRQEAWNRASWGNPHWGKPM
ncbi:hypothetical protein G7Y79_00061g092890 [Physcia stellaris]|nr:hypothetical protein G7Y79_00061g092890 [Physcia stellaris]